MSQGGEPQQRRRSRTTNNPLPPTHTQSRGLTGPQTNIRSDDEDIWDDPPRQNTSAIRYNTGQRIPSPNPPTTPYQRRQSASRELPLRQPPRNTTTQYRSVPSPKAPKRNVHWLLPLGVGMVAMLVLWVFGSLLVAWSGQRYDDVVYGRPRTYQTDAVVGHGDSPTHKSHFIAINYNRQAVVTEWMAGEPSKSINYVVPFYIVGDNSELTPVTLEFRDVTGDNKPDMIIHIHLRTQDQTFVFVNAGTKFRPPTSSDKIQL